MFHEILVGVDLAQVHPLEVSALGHLAQDTIQRGIWLAQKTSASLVFLSAFNLTEEALQQLDHEDQAHIMRTVKESASKALDELVRQANQCKVEATWKLAVGKAWLEIIREVLRGQPDLVVVGTRDLTGFRRMLFGNTAMKLLRRCPCPVWVVKPGSKNRPLHILVATDLKPASENGMALGIALANMLDAHVHVLHVVEYPLDRFGWTGLPDQTTLRYHQQIRGQAEAVLQEQLAQTDFRSLGPRCQIHLIDGVGIPDITIQQFIETHDIDLLVMGTIGRGGIAGVMIGNTAERLLPEVHCSVLAVKPPDFACPVRG